MNEPNHKAARFKRFLQSWLINTLAVLVAVYVLPGLHFQDGSFWTPFITSLVLGILNAFVRPIMMLMALPLLIFTLGLFTLIINACLLYLVHWLMGAHFHIDNFWWALLGAVVINVVSVILNILTGTGRTRIQEHRHRPPPDRPGGSGPVIDV